MKITDILKTKQDIQQFKDWVTNLRSGEFQQTQRKLQDKRGYCCLGVGCVTTISKEKLLLNSAGYLDTALVVGQPYAPKWLRRISNFTRLYFDSCDYWLEHLNDDLFLSFNEIADILELVFYHDCMDKFNGKVLK